jgi:DNA-binding MarR family transcriptional regulator
MDEKAEDFVRAEGLFFFAHLLRRLSDNIVDACEKWYSETGLAVHPRAVSTLHVLYREGPRSVTEIADTLRQSHPLVIDWLKKLKSDGMVTATADPADKRRTLVALTSAGRREAERLIEAHPIFQRVYADLFEEAEASAVDEALWRICDRLSECPLDERLNKAASRRQQR